MFTHCSMPYSSVSTQLDNGSFTKAWNTYFILARSVFSLFTLPCPCWPLRVSLQSEKGLKNGTRYGRQVFEISSTSAKLAALWQNILCAGMQYWILYLQVPHVITSSNRSYTTRTKMVGNFQEIYIFSKQTMFYRHKDKLSAMQCSSYDLTSPKYQVGAAGASVERTLLECWIYAWSPIMLWRI